MRSRLASILAVVLLVATACGAMPAQTAAPATAALASAPAFPVTLVDFQNRQVAVNAKPLRIVSIGPSNTEFLYALGAGALLVGVDDFSNEPAAAKSVDKVGGVKVNLEKVVSLRPDLVVTVRFSDGTIERLGSAGLNVLVVDPQGIGDVARTAILLGRAVGSNGDGLAASIDARLQQVRARTAGAAKPRVFHEVDASDPAKPFTAGPGSYIHDLIEIAGGENVAAKAGSAYPQLSLEEIVRADPEVIVLGDADYGVSPEQVASRPGWSGLSAVKDRKVFGVSGDLVSRPGPRVADAAEAYAKLVHPELFR